MTADLIPVTVLTGFLGAGKTTLLNRILLEEHGHRIAVIENEFGPEGVDHELLVSETTEQIVEMNNGCICCTVRGDLSRILRELATRRARGELAFDRVIIETTGLANPGPVTQTFFMDEDVSERYLLDGVITVVDARHAPVTLTAQPEAQSQVGFADRLLLSKVDLVTPDEEARLRERLIRINPRAPIKPVHFGKTDIGDILDIRGFNLNAILEIDPTFLQDEAGSAHRHDHDHDVDENSDLDPAHEHDDHEHDGHEEGHEAEHEHGQTAHDAVRAFVFRGARPFDAARLEEFLSAIVQVYGADMLRYKGILWVDGSERRVVFQGVHMLMGSDLGRPWNEAEERSSKMVFIGRNLPEETIRQGLMQCMVQ